MDKFILQTMAKRFKSEMVDMYDIVERVEKEISEATIPVANESFDSKDQKGYFLNYWTEKGYNEALNPESDTNTVKDYTFSTDEDGRGRIFFNDLPVAGWNAKFATMIQFLEDAADLLEFVKTLKPKKKKNDEIQ